MHIHAHYQKRMWRGMPLVSSRCILVIFPFKHVTGVYWKSPFSGLKGTSKRICELSFEMARSTSFCAGMLSLPCGQKETFFPLFCFCFFWAKIRKIFIFFPSKNRPIAEKNEDRSQCARFLWLLEENEWELNSCGAGKGLLFATKPSWLAVITPVLLCVLCCHWPLVTFSTALKIPTCQVLPLRQVGMDSLNRHLWCSFWLRNPLWVKNTF